MRKLSLTLAAGLIALSFSAGGHAAAYIKFDGVDGEADDKSTTAEAASRQHKPFVITKPVDKSSPERSDSLRDRQPQGEAIGGGLDRDIIRRTTPPAPPKPAENSSGTTYGPILKVKPQGLQGASGPGQVLKPASNTGIEPDEID